MEERKGQRLALACARALAALASLEKAGVSAWVVGSLARGTFALHSDVDFLVDCSPEAENFAYGILESEMRDFPFHFIPTSDLDETKKAMMMLESADASDIRAYAHQAH